MTGGEIVALTIGGVLGLIIIVMSVILLTGRGSFLIAGFNTMPESEKNKFDRNALCRFMGKILLPIGILTPCIAVFPILNIMWFPAVYIPVVVGLFVFALIYCNTGNRFKK